MYVIKLNTINRTLNVKTVKNSFKLSNPKNVVSLNQVGRRGLPGREVEIRNSGTQIQWRYVGDTDWINIVSLADITGADGREIELGKSATYIQWRYVGDPTWTNLVALADLKGEPGDPGTIPGIGDVIQDADPYRMLGTNADGEMDDEAYRLQPLSFFGGALQGSVMRPVALNEDDGMAFGGFDASGIGGGEVFAMFVDKDKAGQFGLILADFDETDTYAPNPVVFFTYNPDEGGIFQVSSRGQSSGVT